MVREFMGCAAEQQGRGRHGQGLGLACGRLGLVVGSPACGLHRRAASGYVDIEVGTHIQLSGGDGVPMPDVSLAVRRVVRLLGAIELLGVSAPRREGLSVGARLGSISRHRGWRCTQRCRSATFECIPVCAEVMNEFREQHTILPMTQGRDVVAKSSPTRADETLACLRRCCHVSLTIFTGHTVRSTRSQAHRVTSYTLGHSCNAFGVLQSNDDDQSHGFELPRPSMATDTCPQHLNTFACPWRESLRPSLLKYSGVAGG
ncbi:hypothetical protein EDB83DRAFT_2317373 [Lactarius deliciosus]|nr:hypothetical protein EDB83DRAFT_2317373 [Lactarius deliciosus]